MKGYLVPIAKTVLSNSTVGVAPAGYVVSVSSLSFKFCVINVFTHSWACELEEELEDEQDELEDEEDEDEELEDDIIPPNMDQVY